MDLPPQSCQLFCKKEVKLLSLAFLKDLIALFKDLLAFLKDFMALLKDEENLEENQQIKQQSIKPL